MKLELQKGRECGDCTLCCKLLGVRDAGIAALHDDDKFEKERGRWCTYCTPGVGCGIYETRPSVCRDFQCAWLQGFLGDEFKPKLSKAVYYSGMLRRKGEHRPVWVVAEDYPGATMRGRGKQLIEQLANLGVQLEGMPRPWPLPICVVSGNKIKALFPFSSTWEEIKGEDLDDERIGADEASVRTQDRGAAGGDPQEAARQAGVDQEAT